jgi:type I restriction enzyme, S subunit
MEKRGGRCVVEQLLRPQIAEILDLPLEDVKWSTVSLSEIVERKMRLEASVYDIKGKQAREALRKCRWNVVTVTGTNGLATAYHCARFRRIFVNKSELPIFQPSQITDVYPKPYLWIITKYRRKY